MSVDQFNCVEIMKVVREGELSSCKVSKKFAGIVEKKYRHWNKYVCNVEIVC